MRRLLSLLTLVFWISIATAQQMSNLNARLSHVEVGLPYVQNYLPEEYDANHQNFCGLQGSNGLIYIGNSDGLLEYDGERWRLSTLENTSPIMSLAQDQHGQIYYGGYNDFGLISQDSVGAVRFESYSHLVDSFHFPFDHIVDIEVIADGVYFRSSKYLFELKKKQIKAWRASGSFDAHFISEGSCFVHDPTRGVGQIGSQQIKWVVDAAMLDSLQFRCMVVNRKDEWLALTSQDGVYHVNPQGLKKVSRSELDVLLREWVALDLQCLDNGWYVIGTRNGLIILDVFFQIRQVLTTEHGLVGNTCVFAFQDKQRAVWLPTTNGISRIELISPFSRFDHRNGLNGFVNMVHRHQGRLYAAGQHGFKILGQANEWFDLPAFLDVEGSAVHALYLMSYGTELLAASRAGLYVVDGNQLRDINNFQAGSLLRSKKDTNLVFVGYRGALGLLRHSAQNWKLVDVVEEIEDDIREMVEDKEGRLWIEPQDGGIWMVDFEQLNNDSFSNFTYQYFQTGKELPPGVVFLHEYQRQAIFQIEGSMYHYDDHLDSIVPFPAFAKKYGFSGEVAPKHLADPNNQWIKAQVGHKERKDLFFAKDVSMDSVFIDFIDMRRITETVGKTLLPETNQILWHGGRDGIVRQDLDIPVNLDPTPKVLIREVYLDGDSVLSAGGATGSNTPEFGYGHDYRFTYALPSFDQEKLNVYQYLLDGFDGEWSEWTEEAQKDYTRLPHGHYTFRVQAKNIYDQISDQGVFAFYVLPPWYQTGWAYLGYLALAILATRGLVRWRSNQLRNEKIELQQIINARTSELQVRNDQLQGQKLQLTQQAEQLKQVDKLKSRLLANISHEFRTPLTLIKGPLDQLGRFPDAQLSPKNARMMRRNTDRLLRLVNQLLDLSKLDAGALPLNLTEGNVFRCLRAAGSAFSSHAAQRNLDYQIKIPAQNIWASFDRDKIEEVIYNLLSNAFKFTQDHGSIVFTANHRDDVLNIEVTDSGQGIPTGDQVHIFERFYQVDSSTTKSNEGSGIGLSLVKEFVDLMQGDITLESELGKGTSFYISIPMPAIEKGNRQTPLLATLQEKLPLSKITVAPDHTMGDESILIVEDNLDMRVYIAEQLSNHYVIWEASTGQIGLTMAKAKVPDLIITDVMMPEMDGLQLCKLLKSDPATSHIPIIMLTAKVGLDEKIAGLETGADAYLTKPFNAAELEVVVKNLIAQRIKLRQLFSSNVDQFAPEEIILPSIDQEFIQQVLDLLEQKHGHADFGVPAMQKELAMSKTQLHRKMKALTGHAPGEFLRHFRLKRAAQILKTGETVTQTAYAVGFNNLSYFAKCFKVLHGVSPKEYPLDNAKQRDSS